MTYLLQSISILFLKALSKLPFPIIYIISDFFYLIIFYLIGYRKKVVYTNLKNSFPEKSMKEIDQIARRYYRHLCDLILESVKLPGMTLKDLNERYSVSGIELINKYADQGKGCVLIGMHYNNWEWSTTAPRLSLKCLLLIVYNPVRKNQPMEHFLRSTRERFGAVAVPMSQSTRSVMHYHQEHTPACLFLAADQTPPPQSHFWTTFLNQETAFFSGPERIAIKTKQPVFFHYTEKVARGKYHVNVIELFPEPDKTPPDTILLTYVDVIEKIIREQPEYWLWSHRRWKHKRPESAPLIPRL